MDREVILPLVSFIDNPKLLLHGSNKLRHHTSSFVTSNAPIDENAQYYLTRTYSVHGSYSSWIVSQNLQNQNDLRNDDITDHAFTAFIFASRTVENLLPEASYCA